MLINVILENNCLVVTIEFLDPNSLVYSLILVFDEYYTLLIDLSYSLGCPHLASTSINDPN